jgi:hypothetical protein
MYVELKTGYSDNGPAWIGKAFFSRTGSTIYFNGQAFRCVNGQAFMSSSSGSSHFDIESGDSYWISGIKKKGTNRHWAGFGKIMIDKAIVTEYLELTGITELPKSRFELVELNNEPQVQLVNEIENEKF